MKKVILFMMLSVVICTLQAQEKKVASKNNPSEELENLQLASQLARYGYKTFSAEALIQAAKIMSSIKTQDCKYESYKQGTMQEAETTEKIKVGFDMASILASAKKIADGDAVILASIDKIEKANQATRGRVGGPGERYTYVYGNSTDFYEISFIELELAEIFVIGDGDTDLDLYVYDSNGHLIVKDDDFTDLCIVRWVPAWTGRYTIKTVNRGPILNNYHLLTN